MLLPSVSTPNTILLKGRLDQRYDEQRGAGTITPGMLCVDNSSGNLIAHNVVSGKGPWKIAIEDALQGKTIDDNYVSGDLVRFHHPRPGNWYYMLLKAGENVAIGDKAVSAGDGTLQKGVAGQPDLSAWNAGTDPTAAQATAIGGAVAGMVGRFKEAVNNTGGTPVRIRVEIA